MIEMSSDGTFVFSSGYPVTMEMLRKKIELDERIRERHAEEFKAFRKILAQKRAEQEEVTPKTPRLDVTAAGAGDG